MNTSHILRSSFAALTLLATIITAPARAHVHEAAKSADVHTTSRALSAECKRLTVISPVSVVLRQGPTASVSLTGADEDVARVEAIVEKDRVVIRNKGLLGRGPINPVTVIVTLPKLEELRVAQRGQVRTEGLLTGQSLTVEVEGASSVEMLTALDGPLTTSASGPATIKVSGQCARYVAELTGTGHIDAAQLDATDATASVMGEGDVQLTASASLQATVNGPGRVRYSGTTNVTENVGGGGAVVNQDVASKKQ